MRRLFYWVGLLCLGYYGYMIGIERLNQSYDDWVFERHIAGLTDTDVATYLRERSPLGFLVKDNTPTPTSAPPAATKAVAAPAPAANSLLGRIEIARLNLSAMVREGVDAKTLSTSVGHIPSTALAGQTGNFALAAHRDTLFRALKDIKQNDLITFQSANQTFTYRVHDMKIVMPTDVAVLRPQGGQELTLITCYPFYYVGSAPRRFIVKARLVAESEIASR